MNVNEAKHLAIGDEVYWDDNQNDTGIVTEMGPWGFLVNWANGMLGWVDYRDAGKIHPTKLPNNASTRPQQRDLLMG